MNIFEDKGYCNHCHDYCNKEDETALGGCGTCHNELEFEFEGE